MSALREVQGLRARGHEAVLVAPTMVNEAQVTRPDGVKTIKPRWRVGNAAGLALHATLAETWDVIHVHYPFYGTAEFVLGVPQKTPIVVTFHMDAVMGGWREPIARIHRAFIQPWLLRRAKKLFVSSFDYAAASSIASLVKQHDPRLLELPFGVDLSVFHPGNPERAKFGLPEMGTLFLMVGGLDRPHVFKGVPVALRAFAKLEEKNSYLVLRGDGDLKPEFEALAKALGVSGRVIFLPAYSMGDLARLYRSVDVLLFPSTSRAEAFGLVALEAQACATPVIASDWPGVRSVVEQGKTGWLVPPGDIQALAKRMQLVIEQAPEFIGFHEAGVKRVIQRYDQELHLDRLLQAYQEVCGSQS